MLYVKEYSRLLNLFEIECLHVYFSSLVVSTLNYEYNKPKLYDKISFDNLVSSRVKQNASNIQTSLEKS